MICSERRNNEPLIRSIEETARKDRERKSIFTDLRGVAQRAFNFDLHLTASVMKDAILHVETLVGGELEEIELRKIDRIFPDAPSK